MTANQRWSQRPEGSTWGDFGPDDQRGRMNLLTAEKVRQGIAQVEHGITFNLSLPLDVPGGNVLHPGRFAPVLRPTARQETFISYNFEVSAIEAGRNDVISDDLVIMHLQYSTQWDGLAHIGAVFDANGDGVPEVVYYNGYRGGIDIVGPSAMDDAAMRTTMKMESTARANALGVQNMAETCVQGQAVMIDLHKHFGGGRTLIGYDDLMHVINAENVEITQGDMVCLHTGFAEVLLGMNRQPDIAVLNATGAVLDGRDERLLQWITDSGMCALIADNYAVEHSPAIMDERSAGMLPLHQHCIFKLGMHLGELWRLSPLAGWLSTFNRTKFLLTAPPLNLPGAIGSPASPIATV